MVRRLLILLPLSALAACDPGPARPFGTDPVAEPTLFAPGVVSTGDHEYRISFTMDGREAYFTRSDARRRAGPRILVTRVEDGAWSEPQPTSFSTGWEDSPHLTPDGHQLIYSSRRDMPGWGPVPSNDNLWIVERTGEGWSDPVPLAGEVNRPRMDGRGTPSHNETGATMFPDGTLLYSTQADLAQGEDIYAADPKEGRFVNARPLLLNAPGNESSPALSPDGTLLVFHGYRDVYATHDDLFVSRRTEYGWSAPERLPGPKSSTQEPPVSRTRTLR